MHAATDTRLIRCLDGLEMSFAILKHLHSEMHDICKTLHTSQQELPVAFERCWSFIDSVHRIREIAQAVPGLNNKAPEVRVFLESTAIAEEFRHYIQHLRNELMKMPGNTFPVWGSLSWVDPVDPMVTHVALAGANVDKTEYHGCVFDTVERKWVSKVTLAVAGLSFNFDPIFEACKRFDRFVLPWIMSTYAPGVIAREKLPSVTMRLQINVGGA